MKQVYSSEANVYIQVKQAYIQVQRMYIHVKQAYCTLYEMAKLLFLFFKLLFYKLGTVAAGGALCNDCAAGTYSSMYYSDTLHIHILSQCMCWLLCWRDWSTLLYMCI